MDTTRSSTVGETRGRMLRLLRRGRHSIAELAEALGITDNAVRTHIAALERDGLVFSAGVRRDTGGKPSRLYDLTDQAEEFFPKAYAVVLNALIGEIEEADGEERLLDLLRTVGAKAGTLPTGAASDVEERIEAAAVALRELGGDVEVIRTDNGWKLCGFGCPLSRVVTEHEEVCRLIESVVASIVGKPVSEQCDRSGRPRCAFQVTGA